MLPSMMGVSVLLLLPALGLAAPKDGATRLQREDGTLQLQQPLPNPFLPGQEQLGLLRSYLKGLERMEEEPEHMSREQVLLYLFALHDFDQSGQLDGLELLSMLAAALGPGAWDSPSANPAILVVDKVLETQDLNGDGLVTPAELINFPGQTPKEPLAPAPQEPLPPKIPLGQDMPEAPGLTEAGEEAEGRREPLEAVQEARGTAEAEGDGPGPEGDAGDLADAGDTAEAAEELPEEAAESQDAPRESEAHTIQLENDEI
ncbi:cell growth regulator with EF hand domain protein 1 [Echinops telfairi]|uniref:Cell growth regulator with EF hand domain protein 1 n=1 Tax=Echinops telfairi TaxID=9371 RepID=A0ABM0IXN3_ECHTE|nr:cell growth regulator with EF hand domain protein 1 [Echinops telfairi]